MGSAKSPLRHWCVETDRETDEGTMSGQTGAELGEEAAGDSNAARGPPQPQRVGIQENQTERPWGKLAGMLMGMPGVRARER